MKNISLLVLLCCFVFGSNNVKGQTIQCLSSKLISKNTDQKWKGYNRTNLSLEIEFKEKGKTYQETYQARIVTPKKVLKGNPWVWRARFPDWHTEMDRILLDQGYQIAFVNTNNMLGSPKAVQVWNAFYKEIRKKFNLSEKVALEAVSRGGLFAYNWAKINPQKVSCIYAEAPVCDFKSWPKGDGIGRGDKGTWERLKKEYRFKNDKKAKAYTNIPLNGLEALADNKVPILHMIGLKDMIVPPTENTIPLVNKYIKLGGPATVIPCTKGKQNLEGHHFEIETPQIGADFIQNHTPIDPHLDSKNFHQYRDGITNSLLKFTRNKTARVAFLGGSITYNHGWRDSISTYLTKRFPNTKFEFIAAGIPSMGSTPAAFRLERDIKNLESIDLLFEEAAVNDSSNGRTNKEQKRAMEGIVRHLREKNQEMDIVLMHFVDPSKIATYNNGETPAVIKNHESVAKHYEIPSINLALEVTERINNEEFNWKDDFKNLHPSPFGQGVYAHSMITFLENSWSRGVAQDDKVTRYTMPKALDKHNYSHGILKSVKLDYKTKGWEYIPSWVPTDKVGTRANYHHVPMLVASKTNKKLKYKFHGKAIGIAIAAGPDAGILEYAIDNKEWKRQNLATKWSNHIHLPWYYILDAELEEGEHTLYLRMVDNKDQESSHNACRIRYFIVNE
ncbi:SGNH/GDSL hydrolase family protein [Halosquirtibacter laminarini]|uniref:SGNH/GDSL hydrolase family protein n=1 Tax=Halosquirtibacter laminarini TaxID=3374600 RepID=A0AC61NFK5_9BACT|nr:SGNH/GDSL hydrolase family protein [Prolixibacteraceae bacterium]